jgi:hypothetical protein
MADSLVGVSWKVVYGRPKRSVSWGRSGSRSKDRRIKIGKRVKLDEWK